MAKAKKDAAKEIDDFRAAKDAEFQAYKQQVRSIQGGLGVVLASQVEF